jgi:hypothetical protein
MLPCRTNPQHHDDEGQHKERERDDKVSRKPKKRGKTFKQVRLESLLHTQQTARARLANVITQKGKEKDRRAQTQGEREKEREREREREKEREEEANGERRGKQQRSVESLGLTCPSS